MRPISQVTSVTFWDELEKIAYHQSYGGRGPSPAAERRYRRRKLNATIMAGIGMLGGAGATALAAPAIIEAMGGKPSPAALRILTALTGLTGSAVLGAIGAYASVAPPRAVSKLRSPGAIQPSDGELAERHEGHPTSFSSRPFLPSSARDGVVPLSTGTGPGVDGQREDGDNPVRRRKSEYGFRGKETRDYNFTRPVRLR